MNQSSGSQVEHANQPSRRESGQATILVAILMPVLLLFLGLAIEGGNALVQFRKMQSAADMAALVGAQRLPCTSTDTTCQNNALTDACSYAASNGYANTSGSCVAGSGPVRAYVPPNSCSPYSFIDYGNKSSNSSCTNGTAATMYKYIEVQISQPFTIPIFNLSITLGTHAVARHGVPNLGSFAIYSLSPTTPINATTVATVGSVMSNDTSSGGTACDGGYYSAGQTPGGATTYAGGTPAYGGGAPYCTSSPGGGAPSSDNPVNTIGGMPSVSDPYASGVAPPVPDGSFPNCAPCLQPGWKWDGTSWTQGGDIIPQKNTPLEVFPGIYNNVTWCNGCMVYFNPGVYTITGLFDTNHGSSCIFGAPDCNDGGSCANGGGQGTVQAGQPGADTFEYHCSPWGYWDPRPLPNRPGAICPTCGPKFFNQATGSTSSVGLNGVTFYYPSPAQTMTMHGNPCCGFYLAAPNPCPGTGTFNAGGPTVTFPTGASSAYYTYSSGDWAYNVDTEEHESPSSAMVYPSMDYSQAAECNNGLVTWQNEFGTGDTTGQHLQFLFWSRDSNSGLNCSGNDDATWYGIFYEPNAQWNLGGGGACGKKTGIPWVTGQVVVNSMLTNGASQVGVSYRPCSGVLCGEGAGTQLVQ